jgi:hypothetical protein
LRFAVKAKIHPTSIMAGYRLALKEAIKFIKTVRRCSPRSRLQAGGPLAPPRRHPPLSRPAAHPARRT